MFVERIREPEDRPIEIVQSKGQKEKKKNEYQQWRDLGDTINCISIHSPTEPDFHLEVINKQWISSIENEHFFNYHYYKSLFINMKQSLLNFCYLISLHGNWGFSTSET